MADGAPRGRLERVADAIVDGLRRLRNDELAASDLAEVFRRDLGSTERKFIATCAIDAMAPDEAAFVADCLNEEMRRTITDHRELTRITYQHGIAKAVLAGDDARVQFLKSKLEGIEATYLAEDAKA